MENSSPGRMQPSDTLSSLNPVRTLQLIGRKVFPFLFGRRKMRLSPRLLHYLGKHVAMSRSFFFLFFLSLLSFLSSCLSVSFHCTRTLLLCSHYNCYHGSRFLSDNPLFYDVEILMPYVILLFSLFQFLPEVIKSIRFPPLHLCFRVSNIYTCLATKGGIRRSNVSCIPFFRYYFTNGK